MDNEILKVCSICKIAKPLKDFNKNKLKSDGLQTQCRECGRKKSREFYDNNKEYQVKKINTRNKRIGYENLKYCLNYLKEHGCVDCGEKNPICLDFDHVRGIKKYNVSRLIATAYSLDTLKKEIEKCDIRCANCHRKKTAKDFNWYNGIGFHYDSKNDIIIEK